METVNTGLKALSCAMGALAITLVMSWSFVESTAAAPYVSVTAQDARTATLAGRADHAWFGQSEPAALVD